MFEDVLGAPADGFINELKKIQDHLGELQDSYIAVQRLSDFLDEVDEEAAAYLQAYIDQLTPNAEDKRKRFAEVWKRFNSKTVQGMIARAVAAL
jgi:CHAD domain-containing protein